MKILISATLLCLMLCPVLSAQTTNASLGGTVADASGAVVPGASVTATRIDTGVETKAITNETGAYQFASLQPGRYRVTAEMAGFQKSTFDPVELNVSASMRLNFKLAVAGAATTVEVSAAAESPLLASTAVVGNVIRGQQILDLPLIDRSAANLAITQAGFEGGLGEGVNVAGGSTQSLVTTLNGINVSNTRLNRAGGLESFQFSQTVDLVEEVKVITSPADVESAGRALGQVQMIVRSGTNEYHGSLVDGIRNTALNANTFFNNKDGLPRLDLKRHQYAARIGGPIRQNKTFFFFLYDGNRQKTSDTANRTVLTDLARQGIFRFFPGVQNGNVNSNVPTVDANGNPVKPPQATGDLQTVSIWGRDPNRMTPDSTGIVNQFLGEVPLPNNYYNGDGLNTAGFQWQVPSFANKDQFTGKVDHYFSTNHHMNVVFTYEKNDYTSTGQIYPDFPAEGISNVRTWFASLGFTSSFRPTLLNEFRAGAQHPNIDQVGGTRAYPEVYPSINGILYTPGWTTFTEPIPGNIDAQLVDPVYTVADSLTWIRGNHSFKWGFQFDWMVSNSFNINNGVVPSVDFGAGSVPVTGLSTIPGIGQNLSLAQNLLTDLAASVSSINEGFGVADGKNPVYIPYENRKTLYQRDLSFFFKDDFKVFPNLTLNYGIRWDWVGVPFERWGRMPAPINGFGGMFGISGTGYDALWQPGLAEGSMMQIETVGPNSANPGKKLYNDYYTGFAPAIGFSWSIPYWGKDRTVLRVGYGISRPRAQSFLGINGSVSTFGTEVTINPTTITHVDDVTLPLVPSGAPLDVEPLTARDQGFSNYEPDFVPPMVQNFNVSLERQLTNTMTVSFRYVGNITTHGTTGSALNAANIFENGILDAYNTTIAGGNAPLLDQIFMGLNVGGKVVDGKTWTGSMAVRNWSTTRSYFANNGVGSFAAWLNTTNALTGQNGGLLRRVNLPENFVVVNPQYSSVSMVAGFARSWYNSGVIEFQKRFAQGWTVQSNFTWAKTLLQGGGGDGSNTYRNPRNWKLDKALAGFGRQFYWKSSGTYQLPFGPNKAYLNSGGIMSKIMDQWQIGGILTLATGQPLALTAGGGNTFTNGGTQTASVNGVLPENLGGVTKVSNGVIYFSNLTQVTDPMVANITTEQNLRNFSTRRAMAYNGTVLFQNATAGTIGGLPLRSAWTGPGMFNLDMNVSKRIQFMERYSFELRLDAIAMTNTPHFANPTTDINSTSFGRISQPTSSGGNQFTMPANYHGSRVFVVNMRFNF